MTDGAGGDALLQAPVCPTCKLAIHNNLGGMIVQGGIGTYTDHGHVICPCGWWVVTGASDDPDAIAVAHAASHAGRSGNQTEIERSPIGDASGRAD